jgi:hypothetical protein
MSLNLFRQFGIHALPKEKGINVNSIIYLTKILEIVEKKYVPVDSDYSRLKSEWGSGATGTGQIGSYRGMIVDENVTTDGFTGTGSNNQRSIMSAGDDKYCISVTLPFGMRYGIEGDLSEGYRILKNATCSLESDYKLVTDDDLMGYMDGISVLSEEYADIDGNYSETDSQIEDDNPGPINDLWHKCKEMVVDNFIYAMHSNLDRWCLSIVLPHSETPYCVSGNISQEPDSGFNCVCNLTTFACE